VNRSEIDFAITITPPSLFRIDREIAYGNRKYFVKQADMNNSPDQ
jgi:hypothetical protein